MTNQELNDLALAHTNETDPERRAELRDELWGATVWYLHKLPLKAVHIPKDEVIAELSLNVVRWINAYDQETGSWTNYVSKQVPGASQNANRDSRPHSRRQQEYAAQILNITNTEKISLAEAYQRILPGLTPAMAEAVMAVLYDMPCIGLHDVLPGSEDKTYEDLTPDHSALDAFDAVIDRNTIVLDKLPPRHRTILEQLIPGEGKELFDIDFGEPLDLTSRVVRFSTAIAITKRFLNPTH